MHAANRLQRWGMILNYNFKIEFLLSKKLCHADGLSRLIRKHKEPLEDTAIDSLRTEGEFKTTLCNTVRKLPLNLDQIKQEFLNDEFIKQTKAKICEKDQQTSRHSHNNWPPRN